MKIRLFVSGDGPETREAKEFVQRVRDYSDIEIETLDVEDREGKEVAEVYDIYAVPSLLVITDEGSTIDCWLGHMPAEFELKMAINI